MDELNSVKPNGLKEAATASEWLCLLSKFGLTPSQFSFRSTCSSARPYSSKMASTSMAAALAASLPAAAPAPVATVVPPSEIIPASWAKLVDSEAEIPLKQVQLDGLVRLFALSLLSGHS